jgi:copper resistance protein C
LKKIVAVILMILLLTPTIVSAHTGLSSSNPANGQVVNMELQQITLSFEGKIEKLSTMKLIKDGTEIPFREIQVEQQQMIGNLPTPLENGSYTIKGDIPFTVQLEKDDDPLTPTNETDKLDSDENVNDDTKQEQTKDTEVENSQEVSVSANDSLRTTLLIGLIGILGLGLLIFFRKKR